MRTTACVAARTVHAGGSGERWVHSRRMDANTMHATIQPRTALGIEAPGISVERNGSINDLGAVESSLESEELGKIQLLQ